MQVKSIAAPVQARGSLPLAGPLVVSPSEDVRALFEGLFSEFFPRIQRGLFGRIRDWGLAEELTQRMFADVWEQAADGSVDLAGVTHHFAWLWGRARVELARHRASVQDLATADEVLWKVADRATQAAGDVVECRLHVGSVIAGMPAPQRRVLALHVLEDLPVADVAAHVGGSVPEVDRLLADGISRLRAASGVSEADLAVRAEVEWENARRRQLTMLAVPPGTSRPDHIRRALRHAIVEGVFAPGALLPHANVLAALYAPPDGVVWRDVRIAVRVLEGFCRDGLLAGVGGGYRVAAEGPRLAAIPAGRSRGHLVPNLAREMLIGTWPPGTVLPSQRELAQRWHVYQRSVGRALVALAEMGLLVRVAGGRFQVATGTEFRSVEAAA